MWSALLPDFVVDVLRQPRTAASHHGCVCEGMTLRVSFLVQEGRVEDVWRCFLQKYKFRLQMYGLGLGLGLAHTKQLILTWRA